MKKAMLIFMAVVSAALAALAQDAGTQDQNQAARDVFVKAYRVGPGDLLEIKVFELEQLSQVVRVSEDGSITLPLLGRIELEGLTQEGVAAKIAGLLAEKYVKNPQVTVFIKEYKSKQVAVIGAVEKPGSYELVGHKNLLQMVSAAGGFTDQAGDEIHVLREGPDGGSVTVTIDLKDLLLAGNQKLNIPIEPNDVISVPPDREIKVFVFGRVTQPGALKFKISEKVTLLKAIAQAGGWAEGAKQTDVVITRKDNAGKETKFHVNVKDIIKGKRKDLLLQEGDVVFVPESFWTP